MPDESVQSCSYGFKTNTLEVVCHALFDCQTTVGMNISVSPHELWCGAANHGLQKWYGEVSSKSRSVGTAMATVGHKKNTPRCILHLWWNSVSKEWSHWLRWWKGKGGNLVSCTGKVAGKGYRTPTKIFACWRLNLHLNGHIWTSWVEFYFVSNTNSTCSVNATWFKSIV